MIIGILTLELRLSESSSLKEKRMALKSLKDKVRQRFNVSIAEVGGHDKWQVATLAVAYLGTDKAYVDSALSKVVDYVKGNKDIDLIGYNTQLL